jgi:hypothetical protein
MSTKPSSTNRVVAISGHKGAGKDVAADHLVTQYGYEKISFAAPLKDLVARQYNLHRSLMDDRKLKDEPLLHMPAIPTDKFTEVIHALLHDELSSGYWTPRALLILEGSIKRSVSSNYWVAKAVDIIKKNPDKKYVISDLRYKSEADTLKMLLPVSDLFLLRIERPSLSITTTDPSERDLDDYKFYGSIHNIGTSLESYKQTLEGYFKYLLERRIK